MDFFHRLIILMAVLWCCCRCQMIEREEVVLIVKNIFERQSDIMQKLQDMEMQMNSTKQEWQIGQAAMQSGLELVLGSQGGIHKKVEGLVERMASLETALELSSQETVSSLKSDLESSCLDSRQYLDNAWTNKHLPHLENLIEGSTSDIEDKVSAVNKGVNGLMEIIEDLQSALNSSLQTASSDVINKTSESTKITEVAKKIHEILGNVYCMDNMYGGRCYFFSSFGWTWHVAEQYCKETGGSLAKIRNDAEFDFLKDKIIKENWIGMNDIDAEGTYVWSIDSSSHNPDNHREWWAETEPNNYNGVEDCTSLGKKINDLPCQRVHPFICDMTSDYDG